MLLALSTRKQKKIKNKEEAVREEQFDFVEISFSC